MRMDLIGSGTYLPPGEWLSFQLSYHACLIATPAVERISIHQRRPSPPDIELFGRGDVCLPPLSLSCFCSQA